MSETKHNADEAAVAEDDIEDTYEDVLMIGVMMLVMIMMITMMMMMVMIMMITMMMMMVTQQIPTMTKTHHGGNLSVMNMVGICR